MLRREIKCKVVVRDIVAGRFAGAGQRYLRRRGFDSYENPSSRAAAGSRLSSAHKRAVPALRVSWITAVLGSSPVSRCSSSSGSLSRVTVVRIGIPVAKAVQHEVFRRESPCAVFGDRRRLSLPIKVRRRRFVDWARRSKTVDNRKPQIAMVTISASRFANTI